MRAEMARHRPSVCALSEKLVDDLASNAALLRLAVSESASGARIIDAGIRARGSLEAGRRIAEICLGGLGDVSLAPFVPPAKWSASVFVRSSDPVTACLASQYAGWHLTHETYRAMGSGPARAIRASEALFDELRYRDHGGRPALILEVNAPPPEPLIERIAADCDVAPGALTLILVPTASLAGTVQVVARVLEVALHKAHALHFPLERIVDGFGSAPLPPPSPDGVQAMGRTNDAILYGGNVHLFVEGPEAEAAALARGLPSCTSKAHGETFAAIFDACGRDFYAVDPMLFSPARVSVTALESGRSFTHGRLNESILDRSFAA